MTFNAKILKNNAEQLNRTKPNLLDELEPDEPVEPDDPVDSSGWDDSEEIDIGTFPPLLPYSVDYSESLLFDYVRKGDIMYDSLGSGIGNVGIGHVAIIEGFFWDSTYQQYYIRTIEANPNHGVTRGLLSPSRFADLKSMYRVKNMNEAKRNSVISFCVSQLGKPYVPINNLYDIISNFVSQNSSPNTTSWYCSELVWAAYYSAGYNLDSGFTPGVLPAHIIDSSETVCYMSCAFPTTFTETNAYHKYECGNAVLIEPHEYHWVGQFEECYICGHIYNGWPIC